MPMTCTAWRWATETWPLLPGLPRMARRRRFAKGTASDPAPSGETMKIAVKLIALSAAALAMAQLTEPAAAADDALLGVWVAQSMEVDGKTQTGPAVTRVQFAFEKDTLKIKGNFADDREQSCETLALDPSKSPKQLDCVLSPDLLLGIYELKNGELTICL